MSEILQDYWRRRRRRRRGGNDDCRVSFRVHQRNIYSQTEVGTLWETIGRPRDSREIPQCVISRVFSLYTPAALDVYTRACTDYIPERVQREYSFIELLFPLGTSACMRSIGELFQ
uniref:Uncharacterized protein n=1 Tax=Trichogramma kaykai TaxID=54128 RepID=A0ABD2W7I9_9HYME